MKKFFSAILMLIVVTATAQKKSNNPITETRQTQNFSCVDIQGEMNVMIVQNDQPGLEVNGTESQVMNAVTILRGDTLFVYQTNSGKGSGKLNVMIKATDLTMVQVSGKTNVDCVGLRNADNLDVKVKDGAQVKFTKQAEKGVRKVEG